MCFASPLITRGHNNFTNIKTFDSPRTNLSSPIPRQLRQGGNLEREREGGDSLS